MKPPSDELKRQIQRLGEAGIAAMADSPGLAAAVDQHAAAVRDVIEAAGGTVRVRALLDYLDGFASTAYEQGWRPELDGDRLTGELSWQSLRMLAVYWMVRQDDRAAGR